ncbi:MAG TPA: hypothetical protein GXZ42_02845 [Clostridiales bacterium]|nr:hypothetical protein [Clostridiales bacterium]
MAECFVKLIPIILNGFRGDSAGFEHSSVYVTNSLADKTDMLEEAEKWIIKNKLKLQKELCPVENKEEPKAEIPTE